MAAMACLSVSFMVFDLHGVDDVEGGRKFVHRQILPRHSGNLGQSAALALAPLEAPWLPLYGVSSGVSKLGQVGASGVASFLRLVLWNRALLSALSCGVGVRQCQFSPSWQ